ncbi:MAG TPA: hypothetical protein PKD86_12325, partial [Gemmatales bacterium]|nr:hypothetical protein [Gemmatales bacterium]
MAGTWRIGAVEYLNSKPLIHELERLLPTAMLVLDLPSRLADELAAGRLDVALIPVVEFLRGPGYRMLPGIAIASRGAVLSVNVFSRVPWPEIRTLALDVGSTSLGAVAIDAAGAVRARAGRPNPAHRRGLAAGRAE